MWDRGILKSNAKIALGGRYWTAFGVSFVAMLLGGGYSLLTMRYSAAGSRDGLSSLISIGSILYSLFIAIPITIGMSRFFVHNHFGVTQFDTLFSGFRCRYLNGVGVMFITNLFIGLWTLLFIIPGIVKSLEYSMVPYILADNPAIPGDRARVISRTMTNGEKGSIFVLGLSFIGWYLLGTICFVVGIFFVTPYFEATMAELYIYLRDRAIQTNQVNPAELGLVVPGPNPFM
jgi:uncharacterized membrane protein